MKMELDNWEDVLKNMYVDGEFNSMDGNGIHFDLDKVEDFIQEILGLVAYDLEKVLDSIK